MRIYFNLRHISVEWNIRKVIVGVVVEVEVMGWGVVVVVRVRSKDPIHSWHRRSSRLPCYVFYICPLTQQEVGTPYRRRTFAIGIPTAIIGQMDPFFLQKL